MDHIEHVDDLSEASETPVVDEAPEGVEGNEDWREAEAMQDTTERAVEDPRMIAAANELREIKWLQEENWPQDEYERRAALREAGSVLSRHFGWPAPPFETKPFPGHDELLGETPLDGDKIEMNERLTKRTDADARTALGTYCHEYRHTFQIERVAELEQGRLDPSSDDLEQITQWRINLEQDGYVDGNKDFDSYWKQAVERDSRRFSDDLVDLVYRK